MISEDRFQKTIEAGKKNKATAELVHNWCAHAKVTRFGGIGLIEQMHNVPIGHMGLACPHAPAGGGYCWDLADAALQFYDANCVGCKERKPVGFPNLSKLVGERDTRRELQKLENERHVQREADELARRQAERAAIRSTLDAISATNIDLLSELDGDGDRTIGDKLVEVAGLAPETFPTPLVDYLFAVLDERLVGLEETALRILARLPGIDPSRLANTALKALTRFGAGSSAAEIVEAHAEHASPDQIDPAIGMLLSLATHEHGPFTRDRPLIRGPLLNLYRNCPDAIRKGLKRLVGQTDAFSAGLGARGLKVLIDHDPALTGFMTDDLLAKLARAKWLVQGDEEAVRGTLHDIRDVVLMHFHAAPEKVDIAIQQYLVGASAAGINELHKVYGQVLRNVRRDEDHAPLTRAHQIAFSRLVTAATKYGLDDEEDRFTAISDVMHGDPYELTPIVAQEIDNLLGSAAILYTKLAEALAKPRDPKNPMTFWVRQGLRQRLGHTAEVFIKWACKAAGASGPEAIRKVLSVLENLPEGSEQLRGEIVSAFPEFAGTTEGLRLCLPHYYSAMVGPSQLVRSFAATALGEMPRPALQSMPPLVFEAFVALMGDPYNIVHQAAVRALERFSLPEELKKEPGRALGEIIMHYARARSADRFLVTAIEIFAHRYSKPDRLAGSLGNTLLDILMRIEPKIVLQETRMGLPVLDGNPRYAKFFVRLLADPENSEYDIDHLLDYLERHPFNNLYDERVAVADAGVAIAQHWLYEIPSLIEALTACGAWAEAAQMLSRILNGMENNLHFQTRRLHIQLYRIACDIEGAVSAGTTDTLDALMAEWSATLAEEKKAHAQIQQRPAPFEGFHGEG